MAFRPYKFNVVAIVQEVDDDTGQVTGEHTVGSSAGQAVTLFGVDNAVEWIRAFPEQLAAMANPQGPAAPEDAA